MRCGRTIQDEPNRSRLAGGIIIMNAKVDSFLLPGFVLSLIS